MADHYKYILDVLFFYFKREVVFCLMLRYLLLTLGPSQKICSFGLSEYLGMNIGSCFVHVQFLNVVCIYIIQPFKISSESFFRKKKLMVYEMFQQNASKFAIFLEYENPHSFVPPFSFHLILLYFSP